MTRVLSVEDVAVSFGGVHAVAGVSLSIAAGELVGLIGPNGAGKTTLIRVISGLVTPDRGVVRLAGADITPLDTADRVRAGLAITHQIVRPFRKMTTLDNVVLAAGLRYAARPLTALLRRDRKIEQDVAREILVKVGLAGTEQRLPATLPLGQLKRLEIAKALALNPRVILLDEPLAGLNHTEASRQADVIAEVNASGTTVVFVEHNLDEVVRISDRLLVLDSGKLIANGEPREVMADANVRAAYLGSREASHA